jgi:hypothetical protein
LKERGFPTAFSVIFGDFCHEITLAIACEFLGGIFEGRFDRIAIL